MSSTDNHNYVLIMAGGMGTRLWPISRRENPKQFQAFVGQETLLQHMVELVEAVVPIERIMIMAIPKFSELIKKQIPHLPAENLLFEPAQKDTGPAIALGMMQVNARDPEAMVGVVWSDHYIQNPEGFTAMLNSSFATASAKPDHLTVIGVNPTSPNTGFGYIQMGKEIGSYADLPVFTVKRFTEKPDLATATRFVNSWDYLWNVGYEFAPSHFFVEKFKEFNPELQTTLESLEKACASDDREAISLAYEEFPKKSIEYLFTQHLDKLLVVPADLGWSDLGTWNVLHDVLKGRHPEKMVIKGEAVLINTSDSLVFAKDRPIALVGVKDLIVVDDGDVILVMHKDHSQAIKTLTQELETRNSNLL